MLLRNAVNNSLFFCCFFFKKSNGIWRSALKEKANTIKMQGKQLALHLLLNSLLFCCFSSKEKQRGMGQRPTYHSQNLTIGILAAFTSSGLPMGVVTGALCSASGLVSPSCASCFITSMNASKVALLSVSVGSIIIAS